MHGQEIHKKWKLWAELNKLPVISARPHHFTLYLGETTKFKASVGEAGNAITCLLGPSSHHFVKATIDGRAAVAISKASKGESSDSGCHGQGCRKLRYPIGPQISNSLSCLLTFSSFL